MAIMTKFRVRLKVLQLVLLCLIAFLVSGCLLTKIVTVPMRLGGAVISIIPVAGNTAHDAIDEAADIFDDVPL